MREFNIDRVPLAGRAVDVPLLVGETSDGSHFNMADFIASGCATYVRTSANSPGRHHGRDAHRPPGRGVPPPRRGPRPDRPAVHLCMAIPNTTYYESLVRSNPVMRDPRVGPDGLVHAPTEPGISLPDFVHEYRDGSTSQAAGVRTGHLRKERT